MTHPTAWRADGPLIFGTIFHPVYQRPVETVIASVLAQPTGHVAEGHAKNDAARKEAAKLATIIAMLPELRDSLKETAECLACWCSATGEATQMVLDRARQLISDATPESGPLGRPDPLATPGA